jgi:hypothetical protein
MVWNGTQFVPRNETNDPGAGFAAVAPDNIASQSPITVHLAGDADWNTGGGGSNMYQDENGVWRNRRESAPSAPRTGSGSGQQPYAYQPVAPGGGQYAGAGGDVGGGGGRGANAQGSTGTAYGYGGTPVGSGRMNGGGNMAFSQTVGGGIRTQYSSLDPTAWGQDPTATLQQSGTAAQGAVNAGDALMGVNPSVGAAPRTLYDRYSSLLMDPSSMMNDKNVGFMLDQAQEAARRQLAAGRMRHSGNALTELAQVTSGNLMSQFGNLADIYGGGADREFGRWQGETGAGLDAARIRAGALQGAAGAYTGAGQLSNQAAGTMNQRAALDLQRVQAGIASPQEEYMAARNAATAPVLRNDYQAMQYQTPLYSPSIQQAPTYNTWLSSNWGY